MENKNWVILCIIGGILMIVSSTVGSVGFWGTIVNLLSGIEFLQPIAPVLAVIIQIFGYIAMGGGYTVIIGALLCGGGNYGVGKFIIGLGAGMGLFGIIIAVITSAIGGNFVGEAQQLFMNILNGSYGIVGAFLTVIARFKLKPE